MRKMKWLLLLILPLLFASCLENDDDPTQYYDLGEIYSFTGGVYILTDANEMLFSSVSIDDEFEIGNRVLVLYTKVSEGTEQSTYDYSISIDDINKVLTKPIFLVSDENRDTLENDGAYMNAAWISRNYLNVDFIFYGYNKSHIFTLAYDTAHQDVANEYVMEFLHDANNDSQTNEYRGIISYNLNSFDFSGEPPYKIRFRYKDIYGGTQNFTINYTPSDSE